MEWAIPRFRVLRREPSKGSLVGQVTTERVCEEIWIGDRYIGYLIIEDALIEGRWHRVEEGWSFIAGSFEALPSKLPQECSVLDGYWGQRAELVLMTAPVEWVWTAWTDADDHEHCSICWATIYTGAPDYLLHPSTGAACCVPCYDAYVVPRDLSFIEPRGSEAS
jgi:hypothetical protein